MSQILNDINKKKMQLSNLENEINKKKEINIKNKTSLEYITKSRDELVKEITDLGYNPDEIEKEIQTLSNSLDSLINKIADVLDEKDSCEESESDIDDALRESIKNTDLVFNVKELDIPTSTNDIKTKSNEELFKNIFGDLDGFDI